MNMTLNGPVNLIKLHSFKIDLNIDKKIDVRKPHKYICEVSNKNSVPRNPSNIPAASDLFVLCDNMANMN